MIQLVMSCKTTRD